MDYSHLLSEVDRSREERGWLIALAIDLDLLLKKADKAMKQAFNDPVDELPERFHSIIQTNIGDLLRVLGTDAILAEKLLPLRDLLDEADSGREYMETVRRQRPAGQLYSDRLHEAWSNQKRILKGDTNLPALAVLTSAKLVRDHLIATYPTLKEQAETTNPS